MPGYRNKGEGRGVGGHLSLEWYVRNCSPYYHYITITTPSLWRSGKIILTNTRKWAGLFSYGPVGEAGVIPVVVCA